MDNRKVVVKAYQGSNGKFGALCCFAGADDDSESSEPPEPPLPSSIPAYETAKKACKEMRQTIKNISFERAF
jgi:hypothetical protein